MVLGANTEEMERKVFLTKVAEQAVYFDNMVNFIDEVIKANGDSNTKFNLKWAAKKIIRFRQY